MKSGNSPTPVETAGGGVRPARATHERKPRRSRAGTAASAKTLRHGAAGTERREEMIREAAYYRSEKRGFQGGEALEDWLAAERDIDASLEGKR